MYFSRHLVLLSLIHVKTSIKTQTKWTHKTNPTCTSTSSHIKYIYFLNGSWFSPRFAVVDFASSPALRFQSLFGFSSFRLRWCFWAGLCGWWPGCWNTGCEHRWTSGRCRPLCCCRLCGSAELLWSWRASRCCRCPLTSGHSETESGNTCRTEKDMERKGMWTQHTSSNWEFMESSNWALFYNAS